MKARRFMLGAAAGIAAGYAAVRTIDALREARRTSVASSDDSAAYGRTRRALALAGTVRSLAATAAFAYGPLGAWTDRLTSRVPRAFSPALFAGVASIGASVADLPVAFAEDYAVERRYGLTTQTPAAWLAEYAKSAALATAVTAAFGGFGGALLRRAPRTWPLIACAATFPLLIAANVVIPMYVLPMFNSFVPLGGELEDRLRALAARYGVGDASILRMDMSRQTTKANAFVTGVGRSRRIVLGDTLVERFPADEIEFVVAHELGHYLSRDTWRMIFVTQAMAAALFALAARRVRAHDLERSSIELARVVALLSFGAQVLQPAMAAFARSREWAADRFAVEATRDAAAGANAFRRLRDQNRAEERVPTWYHVLFDTHPTLGDRIEALEHR